MKFHLSLPMPLPHTLTTNIPYDDIPKNMSIITLTKTTNYQSQIT